MSRIALAAAAIATLAIAAPQLTATAAETPAVNTSNADNPDAPVPGANSFTEDQARERIAARGYTQVSGLQKDSNGIWRGKAMKDGQQHDVSVDFQGNVTAN